MSPFSVAIRIGVVILVLAVLGGMARSADDPAPNLVPWPGTVDMQSGTLPLTGDSRIVAATAKLLPLAKVLSEEIAAVTGQRLAAVAGPAKAGDVSLEIDSQLRGEQYVVNVKDKAAVRGGDYASVALGSVTLLQALRAEGGKAALPRMIVADQPKSDFRGLLVDVARRYHSIESLKQIVQLCRLYKIRYLQLHLTDDQSFMFPSKSYPLLATRNEHGGKTYTIEQLRDLLAYADARNVTIIPEYEVPGHSAAANRAMSDLFKIKGTKPYEHHASINFAKDDVMKAVETIVGEMCEVFKSTPYFHIGGDEADLAFADQNEFFQAAEKKHNLPDRHELYRLFVVRMNEIVKKNRKQMIVWEGFGRGGKVEIPRDIIVMAYEIRFYRPDDLVKDGYRVVNASWTPLYVVNNNVRPPEEIYAWNLYQFKPFGAKPTDQGTILPANDLVIGAQMCAWEQPQQVELPSLRSRLPAMSERVWNPAADKDFADFRKRFDATDKLLDKLVSTAEPAPAK